MYTKIQLEVKRRHLQRIEEMILATEAQIMRWIIHEETFPEIGYIKVYIQINGNEVIPLLNGRPVLAINVGPIGPISESKEAAENAGKSYDLFGAAFKNDKTITRKLRELVRVIEEFSGNTIE